MFGVDARHSLASNLLNFLHVAFAPCCHPCYFGFHIFPRLRHTMNKCVTFGEHALDTGYSFGDSTIYQLVQPIDG